MLSWSLYCRRDKANHQIHNLPVCKKHWEEKQSQVLCFYQVGRKDLSERMAVETGCEQWRSKLCRDPGSELPRQREQQGPRPQGWSLPGLFQEQGAREVESRGDEVPEAAGKDPGGQGWEHRVVRVLPQWFRSTRAHSINSPCFAGIFQEI